MTEKICLAEGHIKGGYIESDKGQVFKVNYLPEADIEGRHYTEKIELALINPGKDGKPQYASLRMEDPIQLKILILDLADAWGYFLKKKNMLNVNNSQTLGVLLGRDVTERLIKTMRG